MKQYIIWVLCVQWNDTNYLRHSLSFYFHIQIRSIKSNRRVLGRQSACISFFSITFFHIWTSYKLKYSGIFKNLIGIVILVITFCDAVISHVVTSFLLFKLHFWYQEVFKKCCGKQNLEEIEEHTLRQSINLRATHLQNVFFTNNNDTVSSYHVTYAFQSESTLYICLNVKELLAQSRHEIWNLSDCNWTRTQENLVLKRTLNHLAFVECSFTN